MKYTKKPAEVEAVQFSGLSQGQTGEPQFIGDTPDWLQEMIDTKTNIYCGHGSLSIATTNGTKHAKPGDWIVRSHTGHIYVRAPEIFAEFYEIAA